MTNPMAPYKVINDTWIEILEGPFEGAVYKYGRVQLVEEDDQLRVRFEYETPDGRRYNNEFIQFIGPILVELIEQGVINNSITYTGGTDE